MTGVPSHRRGRDAGWLVAALFVVLAWDLCGGDRPLSAWLGGHAGFPLRAPGSWASRAHEIGRWLGALLLGVLLLDAAWPAPPWRRRRVGGAPGSAARRWTAAATVATLLAVPALKRLSATSCPWDVVDYGGAVPWVSHWAWTVVDGGPGHCFPSGHAVTAFAFLVPALAGRRAHPRAARRALAAVLAAGFAFGAVQMLRGAHYLSHVLWSGWLCAALAVAADTLLGSRPRSFITLPFRRSA